MTKKQDKVITKFCYTCKQHITSTSKDFSNSGHSDEKVPKLARTVAIL